MAPGWVRALFGAAITSLSCGSTARPSGFVQVGGICTLTAALAARATAAMQAAAIDDPTNPADVYLPNIYVVSVVSSSRGYPDVYIREPLYSQEYTFIHRP